ncbi:hypothetical protein [Glycomyces sp. MUSA5-2]|uniref:hypothetical protein n=1 Tax=Glycomyces sp. MUSA5-2 TaxID=2053002 RepID=UPI0030081B6C
MGEHEEPEPPEAIYLGDVQRGPAVFTVLEPPGDASAGRYLVECDDGAGPGLVCRLTADPGAPPDWSDTWRRDPWRDWIEAHARDLIADREPPPGT